LNLEIPAHKVSVIIGANGCGKFTLMKTLSRLLKPGKGQVVLDGKAVYGYPSTQLAQMLGLLPQSPTVPEGITVADLVARGRYPYRKFMRNMTKEDYAAVEDALALAQETDILLLDEPTTYLDIAYQVEILDLLTELNRRKGTTIVMILRDVNLSARYADHLFALCRGKLIAEGKPADVITEELMQKVYQLNCIVMKDPLSGAPLIVPKGKY
jgi:iron complex transport system ATP-binding protein